MRHIKSTTIAAVALATAGFAQGEIDTEFHVGYNSTYVWRGQDLGDDAYEYGLDLSGSCDCGFDWSAGIWYINPEGELDEELDIYGGVSKDFGFGTFGLGFIHYEFDETAADTSEIYLSYGAELAGIDFGAAIYYDIQNNDGAVWGEISADYGIDLTDTVSLGFGLNVGTTLDAGNLENYSTFGATIGIDFAVSKEVTLSTYLSAELTEDDGTTAEAGDELFGGASLSFAF